MDFTIPLIFGSLHAIPIAGPYLIGKATDAVEEVILGKEDNDIQYYANTREGRWRLFTRIFLPILLSGNAGSVAAGEAGAGEGVAGEGEANLTKAQLKSISSLEEQIAKHRSKLTEYIKDPIKFDNKGLLKNAPNDAVRQKIIQSRINHLNQEIHTFQSNIQKILNGK